MKSDIFYFGQIIGVTLIVVGTALLVTIIEKWKKTPRKKKKPPRNSGGSKEHNSGSIYGRKAGGKTRR